MKVCSQVDWYIHVYVTCYHWRTAGRDRGTEAVLDISPAINAQPNPVHLPLQDGANHLAC